MADQNFYDIQHKFYPDTPTADTASAPVAPQTEPDMAQSWYGPDGVKKAEVKPAVAPPNKLDKKPVNQRVAKPDTPAPVVTQSYDVKLPDNYAVVDQPLMTEFQTWAKSQKLSNEQVQRAADMHIKSIEAMRDRQATDWSNEIINDADLGGANLEQTMAAAKQTFIDVASRTTGVNLRRLSDDLERTGMATHPDLVRIFSQIGKRLR
jgi:hypothetical protein